MALREYKLILKEDIPVLRVHKSLKDTTSYVFCPDDAVELIERLFKVSILAEEHYYLLCLNTRCKVLGVFLISKGTSTATLVSPREVLIRAILTGADGIITLHNHPSGVPIPSPEDVQMNKRLNESCKIIGVKHLSDIVVGREGFEIVKSDKD